ncbi:MAG: isoprenyl transferase [Bacteroidota bacterium]|uniref:Isoprenyl transferase n=1 Tax=marine metagenome TaxID=408172 RepID=A0A381QRC8_9ZZZZ|nr:isoprenyl transferase [Bacteroidota bacterium]
MDKQKKLPNHIAIIMDGNGRWAKQRNKNRIYGHNQAKKSVKECVEYCVEHKIKFLSLFTFSTENWNRPKLEVKALMKLLNIVIKEEINHLIKQNIKVKVIGDISKIPEKTEINLKKAIDKTKNNSGLTLILAINYSGKWDILNATKKILLDKNRINLKIFNDNIFENYLTTANIPEPELIIRTSGEHRISNFYLWQAAYSELFFTDILWPDFNKKELNNAIFEFQNRERRFGSL